MVTLITTHSTTTDLYDASGNLRYSMKHLLYSTLLLGLVLSANAQGVKISPQPGTPNPSAILETEDSTRGILLPRVNLLEPYRDWETE